MSKRDLFAFLAAMVCAIAVALTACSRATPSMSGASSAPAPTGAARSAALPAGITPELIDAGSTIFNTRSCKNCHAVNGVGSARGPDLTDDKWIHIDGSYAAIVNLVTTGFTKSDQVDPKYQFSMNPRGGVNLSDAEIRAVAAYVWSLSHK